MSDEEYMIKKKSKGINCEIDLDLEIQNLGKKF